MPNEHWHLEGAKYLAGSGSEAEKDIARHAMGLPVGSENTQRLKESAGIKLIEDIKAGKDNKEATAPLVQLYNEKYGADNSSTVYIWGGAPGVFGSIGLDDEYKPVELPVDSDLKRKLTLKDIRDGAKELKKLNDEEKGLQSKIAGFCEELGIGKPF